MTRRRMYQLAYYAALDIWDRETTRLESDPDNTVTQYRAKVAETELNEIANLLLIEEQREKKEARG